MLVSDFDYNLPEELIAQHPTERREMSRMLAVDRVSGKYELKGFTDFQSYLRPGDCLVLNDTKVIPARLWGHRAGSGGRVQAFMLEENKDKTWKALLRPGRRLSPGSRVELDGDDCGGFVVVSKNELDGTYNLAFDEKDVLSVMEKHGKIPLPPYINRNPEEADFERYQTVYSREVGSAAAPTAGLHFTRELLQQIADKGVNIAFVTLHVGLGTFRPVKAETIDEHHMHSELCMINHETAELLNQVKANGGRIVCVGTTSCRTLESLVNEDGTFEEKNRWTDIFIYPGYRFRAMDALITNFHLPESTLVMLVSAFAGRENVLDAYEQAVNEEYRFFSFGDAMYIG